MPPAESPDVYQVVVVVQWDDEYQEIYGPWYDGTDAESWATEYLSAPGMVKSWRTRLVMPPASAGGILSWSAAGRRARELTRATAPRTLEACSPDLD